MASAAVQVRVLELVLAEAPEQVLLLELELVQVPELEPVPGQIPSGSEAAAERAEAAVQVLPPSLQSAALPALVASLPAEAVASVLPAEAVVRAELPAEAAAEAAAQSAAEERSAAAVEQLVQTDSAYIPDHQSLHVLPLPSSDTYRTSAVLPDMPDSPGSSDLQDSSDSPGPSDLQDSPDLQGFPPPVFHRYGRRLRPAQSRSDTINTS